MSLKTNIDAPVVPTLFLSGGVIIIILGLLPPITLTSSFGNFVGGFLLIISGLIFLRTSLKGKTNIWCDILKKEPIDPNGTFLDIGCGQGAVLFRICEELTTGTVTGIDIWKNSDQSNNSKRSMENKIRDLKFESVAKVITADMRNLPFKNNDFDLVTASFSIHNVKPSREREHVQREIARVLKKNGDLIIVDMGYKDKEYVRILKELNFNDIKVTKIGFDGWWGGPWAPSFKIEAVR